MAPQISTCKLLPEANALVCTISYGNAYASINARETEDGKGTVASVELIGLRVWRNLLVIVCVLLVTEILSLVGLIPILHLAQWIGMGTIAIGWTIGSLIMVSLSKKVLKKYIAETLNDGPPV